MPDKKYYVLINLVVNGEKLTYRLDKKGEGATYEEAQKIVENIKTDYGELCVKFKVRCAIVQKPKGMCVENT